MNKKLLMIIASVVFLLGAASAANGIFWMMSASEAQSNLDEHNAKVADLLKKSEVAQSTNDPKAKDLLDEMEKENRYAKYAGINKDDAAADRNLYLGIGIPLLIAGLVLFVLAKKKASA